MSPPMATITAQAAVLSIVSGVVAQAITAFRQKTPLSLDGWPILQFFLFAILTTPPNVCWQVFLESTFPGTTKAARWRNTLTKTLLDQTVGSAANVLVLCVYVGVWEEGPPLSAAAAVVAAAARTHADFWPIMRAGWRFWPWVSLGNFALVHDVATRNLVGSLAGIAWGVYLSLATAASVKAE